MQPFLLRYSKHKQRESRRFDPYDNPDTASEDRQRHTISPKQLLPPIRTILHDVYTNPHIFPQQPRSEKNCEKSQRATLMAHSAQRSDSGSSAANQGFENDSPYDIGTPQLGMKLPPFTPHSGSFHLSPASFTPSPPTQTVPLVPNDFEHNVVNGLSPECQTFTRQGYLRPQYSPQPLVGPKSHSLQVEPNLTHLLSDRLDSRPSLSSLTSSCMQNSPETTRRPRATIKHRSAHPEQRKKVTRPHQNGCTCRTLEGQFPTWLEMLKQVIRSSQHGMLTLQEIRMELARQFPCVRDSNGDVKAHDEFQNTIRQNLSSRSCFDKVVRPPHRKNHYWVVVLDEIR